MFFGLAADGQTVKQYQEEADLAWAEGDYYAAEFYYDEALKLDGRRVDLRLRMAHCLRLTNNYQSALDQYSKIIKQDRYGRLPIAGFWLAEMQKMAGQYADANATYREFIDRYSKNDKYAQKAQMELRMAEKREAWLGEEPWFEEERLPKGTIQAYADLNLNFLSAEEAIFTGSRRLEDTLTEELSYPTYLFRTEKVNDSWRLKDSLDLGNEKYYLGATSIGRTKDELYLCLCERLTVSNWRCGLFKSNLVNGAYSKPESLGESYSDPNTNNTHPYVAKMKDGRYALFFSSDREGGKDDLDVWMAYLDDDGFPVDPKPMQGELNSPFNDGTPFYDPVAKRLYFSSEWHGGIGGTDIFYVPYEQGMFPGKVEYAGVGLNSSYNDLFFSIDPDRTTASVTSNRKGSLSYKGEACCTDIWVFNVSDQIDTITPIIPDTPILAVVPPTDTPENGMETPIDPPGTSTDHPGTKEPVLPPIKQMQEMLPLKVYFHNDEPEPNTTKDYTWIDYRRSFNQFNVMEEEYRESYASSRPGGEDAAKDSVTDFFEGALRKGMNDLDQFCSLLQQGVEEGNTVEGQLKAHCSPLALNDYNINLAKRRISSVLHFFERYNGGVFTGFEESLSLTYPSNAVGEEEAPADVNDDPNYVERSIFAPDASLERRVEIVGVIVQ